MRTNFIPIEFSITIGGLGESVCVHAVSPSDKAARNMRRTLRTLFLCGVTEFDAGPLFKVPDWDEVIFWTITLCHCKVQKLPCSLVDEHWCANFFSFVQTHLDVFMQKLSRKTRGEAAVERTLGDTLERCERATA